MLSVNTLQNFWLLASIIAEPHNARGFSQREMTIGSLMTLATYQAVEQANLVVTYGSVLDTSELTETLRTVVAT